MNYHKISYDDQLNGEGLRVVLFLSGCNHYCKGCQNPQTWDPESGKLFDQEAMNTLFSYLEKDYISGVTFSGGDPFHPNNLTDVYTLARIIKTKYPNKTIWVYTGYAFDEAFNNLTIRRILQFVDILVDGKFEENKLDNNYKWAGSTNQRIIDVQATIKNINELAETYDVVLYETE